MRERVADASGGYGIAEKRRAGFSKIADIRSKQSASFIGHRRNARRAARRPSAFRCRISATIEKALSVNGISIISARRRLHRRYCCNRAECGSMACEHHLRVYLRSSR